MFIDKNIRDQLDGISYTVNNLALAVKAANKLSLTGDALTKATLDATVILMNDLNKKFSKLMGELNKERTDVRNFNSVCK